MPGLRRPLPGRRRIRGDQGSVQVLFGILVASGMLLAMLAVVVDGGRLQVEHAELRSGADAAALAVARGCVEAGCDPSTAPTATAGRLAAANAGDGAADVARVCGRGPGLAPCPETGTPTLATCDADPPTGSYVEVSARTRLPDGTTVLPPVIAGSVFGTYSGTTVGACARAAWGAPRRADRIFPLMISACAWRQATAGGTEFTAAPSPAWDPPDAEEDSVHAETAGCAGDPSSAEGDLAVLLGPADLSCSQSLAVGDEVTGFPAGSLTGGILTGFCQGISFIGWLTDVLRSLFSTGRPTVVHLAVYDRVQRTGTLFVQRRYHVAGFAAFELTGAAFGILALPSWRTGLLCGSDPPCLRGFFTRQAGRGPIAPGGENFGVYATQLVG